jgi:hypothetical protein
LKKKKSTLQYYICVQILQYVCSYSNICVLILQTQLKSLHCHA